MKRVILILAVFVGLGICANAQNLQRGTYNDGRILAYIEQYQTRGWTRSAQLIVKNISNNEITVNFCLRSVINDENHRFVKDKMIYFEETLRPGEDKSDSGYQSGYGSGYYFVESFAIMNVSVRQNTPQSGNRPQQSVTVPSWALGTWDSTDTPSNSNLIIITSSQLIWGGDIYSLIGVDGDIISFDGDSWGTLRIIKTNIPNQMQFSARIQFPGRNPEWRYITYIKR
jgi:hypothetical protein